MEHIEIEAKEKEEGGTPSERGVDALTKVLGKKDHRGYVKGFGRYGVGVGHQQAFGKEARKSKRATPGYEEVEALKASLTEEFDLRQARMEKELEERFQQRLQERVAMEVQTYLASLSPNMLPVGPSSLGLTTPPQEPPIIKEVTKCRLAVHDEENEGNLVVVAEGQVYPDLGPHVHGSSVLSGHYRVSVDSPYEEHWSVLVPVPDGDNVRTVGAAKDCFLQWPKSLVLFADKMPLLKMKSQWSQNKERVSSCDIRLEESFSSYDVMNIGGSNIANLTENCELLHVVMTDEKHDTVKVVLKAPLFYFEEDREVWVTATDISEFLRGACANISLIHVYVLFLVERVIPASEGENVTFLCPQMISGAECKRVFTEVTSYVKHAFCVEAQMKELQSKFILAPYNEDNHWILIVIDLRVGVAYLFDSVTPPAKKKRQLSCENVFVYAYKSYRAKLRGSALKNSSKNLVFKQIECAQQTGGTECDYFIMRYMFEILTRYRSCNSDLKKDYIGRSTAYSTEEIGEIREQWADFFRSNFLVS